MKKLKPITPGQRGTILVSYRGVITKKEPHKKLTKGRKRHVGRSSSGRISVRHKGGGHKRLWREIDFKYDKKDIPARVETIEYDPNRSAFIALVVYTDGERRYVVAPRSWVVGSTFLVSVDAPLEIGNRTVLQNIPVGTFVYNVEVQPGSGAKFARSAGSAIEVVANADSYTHLKMPSGEIRKVKDNSWASIGTIYNEEHKLRNLGKAGRSRWLGIRPTVRGSAMNPVDHPHGGGEGRSGIGLRRGPKTRQGKQAYGVKTRRKKKYSSSLIIKRRKNAREMKR